MDVLQQILENLHQGQIQLAVNKQSVTGWSPLIVASSKGHLDIVKVILHENYYDLKEGTKNLTVAALDIFGKQWKSGRV